jgi:hypothetical protein
MDTSLVYSRYSYASCRYIYARVPAAKRVSLACARATRAVNEGVRTLETKSSGRPGRERGGGMCAEGSHEKYTRCVVRSPRWPWLLKE